MDMMKFLKPIVLFSLFSLLLSTHVIAQKEIFIKQIDFELQQVSDIEYENEFFMTMKFNKGSKYVFRITNNINDKPGIAVLDVFDADTKVLTNDLGEDKYYEAATFLCNKTEFYDILVRFRDNNSGHCQIEVVLVQ